MDYTQMGMLTPQEDLSPTTQMLTHPGYAMANQSLQNIFNARRGQPTVNAPAMMSEMQRQNMQLQMRRDEQLRRDRLVNERLMQQSNPAFEFEQLRDAGHLPPDMTYEGYMNSSFNRRGASSRAFAPQIGTVNGRKVMLTPTYDPSTGATNLVETPLPAGWVEDSGIEKVDTGDAVQMYRRSDGAFLGAQPKALAPKDTLEHIEEAASVQAQGDAIGKKKATASSRIEQLDTMLEMVDSLLDNESLGDIYGRIDAMLPTVRQGSRDAEASVRNLVARRVLDEREKLKGQGTISDFESKMLGDAATLLQDFTISEEKAREELERMREVATSARRRAFILAPPSADGWTIERE